MNAPISSFSFNIGTARNVLKAAKLKSRLCSRIMLNVALLSCKISYLNHRFGRDHTTDGLF